MNDIKLSWVITTYNKMLFLKDVLTRLINQVQKDEEIIVIDGGSTDGTVEYCQELSNLGRICQFISEPDQGEAHGYNKGILLARGELIKLLSDDDDFYWPGIQACKEFMLAHPEIDILGTDGAGTDWSTPDPFIPLAYCDDYEKWRSQSIPFSFCCLGLMIRRNSLPLLGLFHTGIVRVDAEFSLRITSGSVNLAWYTGYNWVRIMNQQSNSVTQSHRINLEGKRLDQFYLGIDSKKMALNDYGKFIKSYLKRFKSFLIKDVSYFPKDWSTVFVLCDKWLREQNEIYRGQFLLKSRKS